MMLCNYWMQKRDENRFYAEPEMRITLGASRSSKRGKEKEKKIVAKRKQPILLL